MTLAERRAYQQTERAAIAEHDPAIASLLTGEQVCWGCGCSDTLACPEGCTWTAPGMCSACTNDQVILIPATRAQIAHTAAWLRLSVVDLERDEEGMTRVWERTPVGEMWATLAVLAGDTPAGAAGHAREDS